MTATGQVDIAQIPEALVQRVDIVTGGASAAYGSDAVAGVVNFVLDTKFEGLKADAQTGISQYGDDLTYKVDGTWGGAFLQDRLHVVASVEDYRSDGVYNATTRPWTSRATTVISNPNVTTANPASPSNPTEIVAQPGISDVAACGGLIPSGPLKGTWFAPGGTPEAFQYGSYVGSTEMEGGGPPAATCNPNLGLTLQPSEHRDQFYSRSTFEFSDDFSAFFEVIGATNHEQYLSLPTFELSSTAFTIFSNNAFLPASIASQMAADKVTSFTLGRISQDIATPTMDAIYDSGTIAGGFNGKIGGSSWSYEGYAHMGENFTSYKTRDDPISDNLYAASNAVVNPANGQIVCAVTLTGVPTGASPGCVPINLFGYGSPSAAALQYVTGTAIETVAMQENLFNASARGDLFDLPAGTVSLAFGGGYRYEAFTQKSDARSQEIRTGAGIAGYPSGLVNTLGGYERTNPQPTGGSLDVWESFVETEVPLLKGEPLVQSLSLNAAARWVDYNLSGSVFPWKVGAVWDVIDGVRIRASRSTDIRAPNLGELYQASSQGTSTVNDPANGNASVTVLTGAVGNASLVPESANTETYGVVLTPDFLPGLTQSLDYYNVNISKAISTLTAQQELTACAQGATSQCAFIIRGVNGALARVTLPFFNAAFALTNGVDSETDYHVTLSDISSDWDGDETIRIIANYMGQYTTQIQGAAPVQNVSNGGTPRWLATLQSTTAIDRWKFFAQERMIGETKINNLYGVNNAGPAVGGLGYINFNEVPMVWYTDATLTYSILPDDSLQAFLTINNLFDRDPPWQSASFLISGSNFANRSYYDLIGRTFTMGVHYRM